MFLSLLTATFLISLTVCAITAHFFKAPLTAILNKIVADSIAFAWQKYLTFAIYVVGISGGVRIYYLEDFLEPAKEGVAAPVLGLNHWVLEIYHTIIGSLQSITWMLLIFFVFALIAYVLVRNSERRQSK